ncbi:MAG: peptidoglycan editing factor PgeF [Rhodobiaceae bacterium]|nr:peptidoglycan editing factor PgeF [Rhodobiaceae bacterium]MCC0056359.1 peptidoglycan editing factor PgeF [Rhodobiaceae bacterium]
MKLEAPVLSGLSGIAHGFFGRRGGVSEDIYASLNIGLGSRDDPASIRENRGRIAKSLGVDPRLLLTPYQIHSDSAVIVTDPWPDYPSARADGIVTSKPGLAVAVSTADCSPILFADPKARVVGAAHAGWKGAIGGILEATVARMLEIGANEADIVAVIGPTISQPSYEVGPEFLERFVAEDAANERFFRPSRRDRHLMFDLPGYIGARLARLGLAAVDDTAVCTYLNEDDYFSYRRATHRGEKDYGRQISAILLTD